ncbi:MAG: SDR family NAD(P)-dependent oxidoreductase [Thalassobaculum sp.]|uniref:SDR family NAD(P)-dependent oxidoreductase n=1 Tax=Thalassobaculum sp. TaxID=2022740 RepID=UPI0032EC3534
MDTAVETLSPLKRALVAIEELQARLARAEGGGEPVAIVGIGCRLPGGVDGPDAYWDLLAAGRDGIVEVPADRWAIDDWYDPDRAVPGRMNLRRAGFLAAGIAGFDAEFFGIAPREATAMDPQQRLLLEVAWQALEDAGIAPDRLAGSACGVFVGLYNNNYTLIARGSPAAEAIDGWSASGTHTSIAAGRLSYSLGLTGPSLAVDTACSSSLVAVHLAVRAIQTGECAMALAGGVHLMLGPEALVASTKLGATAPDGRCKTFDAAADGFGHGEGCGVVVLKPLAAALAAGDRVVAVIRGSAVNQDGRSNSLTAPNGPAQEAVIRAALARAGVAPGEVGYVEAHGTGTRLGDPIEIEAIAAALGEGRTEPLLVGSAKTNLGHLEAAAGIAGLIKAALCVNRGAVPPHLNFTRLNPEIDAGPVDLRIPTATTPWDGIGGRRIAGVSGFGFGGTNAHVVLEAPPPVERPEAAAGAQVLALSAATEPALRELADAWADWLESTDAPLADAAVTAATGRAHLGVRLAVAGDDKAAVAAALRKAAPVASGRPPKIAFLFTGQGAQYPGMAKQAYARWPVFRAALDRHAAVLDAAMGRSALDLLFGDGPLDATELAQPLLVAVELALAALWRSWGIEPAAVLGHSVGEIAAAAVAGVLSEEDALRLAVARGRLMQSLPAEDEPGGGGMLAAFASADAVERHLDAGLSVAGLNGPANTVVAGPLDALDALAGRLAEAGIESRRLAVSHGFHSALLDSVLSELERIAGGVATGRPAIPVVSNLTGRPHEAFDGAYWREHARRAVRFEDGLHAAAALGCVVFLEIGPQPVLSGLGAAVLDDAAFLPSLRRGAADDRQVAETLGRLYERGAPIDWRAVHRDGLGRRRSAPTYRFQHRRYWLDLPEAAAPAAVKTSATGSATVYDFYDELTVVSRTYDGTAATADDQEGHLTFGFMAEPVPGFSWVRALFEKDADPAAHDLFRRTQRALKDSLFDGIDFARMRRVFDYGCGHAADLCSLAQAHPHLKLQGFTISDGQVRVGTERIARLGLADRVRVHRNDSSVVPFPGSFDLIYGFEVTGLIEDKDGLFDNVAGHLAPGGLLVVADFVSTGDAIDNRETHSFTPGYDDWIALLSRRRLRLVRAVDASAEVANWLDDPEFEANVDAVVARFGLGDLTRRHLLSNGNIGRALRADVMRYLLLTAQHSPYEDEAALAAANTAMLRGAVPYRDTARARAGAQWQGWLYGVEWRETAASAPLPGPAEIAAGLAPSVDRERMALESFGDTGAVLDRLSLDFTVQAFRTLGCRTVADAASVAVAPAQRRLRDRLVAVMAAAGLDGLPDSGDVAVRAETASAEHPDAEAELALLRRCGPELAGVLAGRVDPLALLFPGGDTAAANRLYEQSPYSRAVQRLAAEAVAALPRDRPLSVIEIGGGTGATTAHLLDALPTGSRYLFTDLGASLVAKAEERFAGRGMEFARLDIARPPSGQGIAAGAFDLVVAANVLHATPDLARTLGHARELMAPGGLLLMVENTGTLNWGDLTFGLTDGMWNFTDTALRDYALLRREQWRDLLPACRLGDAAFLTPGEPDRGGVSQQCVMLARHDDNRHWLLAGGGDRAAALAAVLERAGDRVTLAPADPAGVPEGVTDAVLLAADGDDDVAGQQAILGPALALAQAAARMDEPPQLAVVTAGALPGAGPVAPARATLPGFVRAVAGELPDARPRLVDIDAATGAEALAAELAHGRGTEVALRGGRRLVPSLVRRPAAPAAAPRFDPAAAYLVTGAFGGLGLEVARWLAAHGARTLLLAGRSDPSPAAAKVVEALRADGVEVAVRRCDVGDRGQVEALLAAAPAPLKGVVHAAGALADAGLSRQTWDGFEAVLRAKLHGAWNLHELTAGMALDHFVLFASAAGLLGPAGQANHAAANSFLDGLAAWRRQQGLPGVSIDWGAWAEIGAVPKAGVEAHVGRTGLLHMAPDEAMRAFAWAMAARPEQVAVLDADWAAYRRRFPLGGMPTLLDGLGRAVRGAPAPTLAPAAESLRGRIAAAPAGRRIDLLCDAIRDEAARIMRHPDPAAIDDRRALRDLGLDSLMSVELRNALVARLDRKLPATLLFDHPSVAALAAYVAAEALPDLFAATAAGELDGLDARALSELLDAELGGAA